MYVYIYTYLLIYIFARMYRGPSKDHAGFSGTVVSFIL